MHGLQGSAEFATRALGLKEPPQLFDLRLKAIEAFKRHLQLALST
eukprot:CAMPEP_0171670418 /NCGR_PEP_ID=MMETSP0990-20121206/50642_1 /TAXON_ID=483369 /ORGANISM="non described non described, Strain CCMP2098" /LENGTH=44 /DNA_ID= /DNA_START= /DNA_END= /DNA_ORIENTATION=